MNIAILDVIFFTAFLVYCLHFAHLWRRQWKCPIPSSLDTAHPPEIVSMEHGYIALWSISTDMSSGLLNSILSLHCRGETYKLHHKLAGLKLLLEKKLENEKFGFYSCQKAQWLLYTVWGFAKTIGQGQSGQSITSCIKIYDWEGGQK